MRLSIWVVAFAASIAFFLVRGYAVEHCGFDNGGGGGYVQIYSDTCFSHGYESLETTDECTQALTLEEPTAREIFPSYGDAPWKYPVDCSFEPTNTGGLAYMLNPDSQTELGDSMSASTCSDNRYAYCLCKKPSKPVLKQFYEDFETWKRHMEYFDTNLNIAQLSIDLNGDIPAAMDVFHSAVCEWSILKGNYEGQP